MPNFPLVSFLATTLLVLGFAVSGQANPNQPPSPARVYRGILTSVLQDSCDSNGEINLVQNSPVVDALLPTFDACLGRTKDSSETVPHALSFGTLAKTGGSGLNIAGTGLMDAPHGPGIIHCKVQRDQVEFSFPRDAPRIVKYSFIAMNKANYEGHRADFDKVSTQLDNLKYQFKLVNGELHLLSISRALPSAKAGEPKALVGTFNCNQFTQQLTKMSREQIQTKAYQNEEFRTCAAFWPGPVQDDQRLRWAQCAARRSLAQYPSIPPHTPADGTTRDQGHH